MKPDILRYYSLDHAGFLHAKGKMATHLLIIMLSCRPGEQILEIGCGTGASLVEICSRHKKTRFSALESSRQMYLTAKSRLQFTGLKKAVDVRWMETKNKFPFRDESFDKIYIESVLAIQNAQELQDLLSEINRVLRPEGILILNETLWLESTGSEDIRRINEICISAFGIPQCSGDYPYLRDWKDLIFKYGFDFASVTELNKDINTFEKLRFSFPAMLSFLFTAFGKIRSVFNTSMRREKATYYRAMKNLNPENKALMHGVLIKATKRRMSSVFKS